MKTMSAPYILLVVFGGLLMVLGIVTVGDVAQHAVFLAFGTICLIAAGVIRRRS